MVAAEAESLSLLGLFHGEKDKVNVRFHGWLATPNGKQISYGHWRRRCSHEKNPKKAESRK
jgi:hypothetical protein